MFQGLFGNTKQKIAWGIVVVGMVAHLGNIADHNDGVYCEQAGKCKDPLPGAVSIVLLGGVIALALQDRDK